MVLFLVGPSSIMSELGARMLTMARAWMTIPTVMAGITKRDIEIQKEAMDDSSGSLSRSSMVDSRCFQCSKPNKVGTVNKKSAKCRQ